MPVSKLSTPLASWLAPGFINAHYHSHDVMAKCLFEEMPFDIWTLHSNPIPKTTVHAPLKRYDCERWLESSLPCLSTVRSGSCASFYLAHSSSPLVLRPH